MVAIAQQKENQERCLFSPVEAMKLDRKGDLLGNVAVGPAPDHLLPHRQPGGQAILVPKLRVFSLVHGTGRSVNPSSNKGIQINSNVFTYKYE